MTHSLFVKDLMHKTKPTIGINGRFLIAKRTGVQRSAFHMFKQVIALGQEFNFVLFTGPSEVDAWNFPNLTVVACALETNSVLKVLVIIAGFVSK